ncbi:hypothetical protein FJ364_05825, partial [Candidatus Dependentiae bacterium]|nr:hypothetical protein [Candidatus Dependentiae bacterium]
MDGLTITLDFFINEEAAPILVSQSVLLQFAKTQATKTTTEQCKTNSIYISRVWQNNKQGSLPTSYYLIIPKQLASKKFLSQEFKENHTTFGQQLALNASFGIRSEVLTTIDQTSWAHVIKHLEGNLFGVGFSSEFWKDFFLSDNYVSGPSNVLLKPWSFMFFCHGKPHDMVGISQQDVQKFFLFLSEELNTKVVALTSCFIGGHLKDKLCTAPDGRPLAFTFNLITSSLNDVPLVLQKNQYTRGLTQQLFEKCDEEAINLATILNLFTRLVTPVGTYVSHGQIRAAGCERFEIPQHYSDLVKLTPSKNVSPLQNKKRKLINTEEFASCLFTSPQHPSITHQKKEATPVKATFTTKTIALGEKMFNRPLQISPTIRFPSQQTLLVCADYYLKNFLERPLLDIDSSLVILHEAFALAKERNQPLSLPIPTYPDMISTLYDEQPTSTAQRTSTHFLEKIVLSNEDEGGINPFLGILSFIRDGFFCSQYRLSKNCICIKKLQGFNDLSLLFECMNIKDNEEIEDALQPLANQVIEL